MRKKTQHCRILILSLLSQLVEFSPQIYILHLALIIAAAQGQVCVTPGRVTGRCSSLLVFLAIFCFRFSPLSLKVRWHRGAVGQMFLALFGLGDWETPNYFFVWSLGLLQLPVLEGDLRTGTLESPLRKENRNSRLFTQYTLLTQYSTHNKRQNKCNLPENTTWLV